VSPVRGARGSVPLRESGQFPPGVKEALAMCGPGREGAYRQAEAKLPDALTHIDGAHEGPFLSGEKRHLYVQCTVCLKMP
jgi:hypothetical protein